MKDNRDTINQLFDEIVGEQLNELGLSKFEPGRWRDREIEVRVQFDNYTGDPYIGERFTVEFQRIALGKKFQRKSIAGTLEIPRILDQEQLRRFVKTRNAIAASLTKPSNEYLKSKGEYWGKRYLEYFAPREDLEITCPMYSPKNDQSLVWMKLIATEIPVLVERARTFGPSELVMKRSF